MTMIKVFKFRDQIEIVPFIVLGDLPLPVVRVEAHRSQQGVNVPLKSIAARLLRTGQV